MTRSGLTGPSAVNIVPRMLKTMTMPGFMGKIWPSSSSAGPLPASPQSSKSLPRRRPSPLGATDQLVLQRKQLEKRRHLDPVNEALFPTRLAQIDEALARAASHPEAGRALSRDTIAHSAIGRFIQATLTKLVHPAASWLPPRKMAIRQCAQLIDRGVREGWAQRTTFWADDAGAALLDGLVIAKGFVAEAQNKPRIVVVPGFAMTYEAVVPQAKKFADDFDVVVVLHNSRGVGRSLGVQYSIDQAVEDSKAVLRSLIAEGHLYLGAYGISMGSATLFRAIEELADQGELPASAIGLAASIRGPSSIPNVVGAHLGFLFAKAARWLLRSANLPDMDVTRILQKPLPAAEVMITTATTDRLVKKSGQLAQALHLPADGVGKLPSGQDVTVVANHGRYHIDPNIRTPEHDAVLERWAHRAKAVNLAHEGPSLRTAQLHRRQPTPGELALLS